MKYLKRIDLKEIAQEKRKDIKNLYQKGTNYYKKIDKNKTED